ncbi:MAG: zinc-binding dehydrogenase [Armatimonadota bacterium]
MNGKAAVLEEFGSPLTMREYDVSPLAQGEVLVKITAAGVCGSDVHIARGEDPRTPLPIILGHEGVGEVADIGGTKTDIFGTELAAGDPVMWERGIMCGRCYFCLIKKQPALCLTRKTYGISVSCEEPPHFRGCYGEYLHLLPGAHMIKLDGAIDPTVLVSATCSGATAAHTVQLSNVNPGDDVLIIGPGPVGLWVLAFCVQAGAGRVWVSGTTADKGRLELSKEFGASGTVNVDEHSPEERLEWVMDATHGIGIGSIIDCTGVPQALADNIAMVAPYGTYSIPGIATPVGEWPVALYEHLARKNVNLQGVWVSDTSHLYQSIRLVQSGRFPFEKLVTHTYPLEEATQALEVMESREAIKAVFVP